MASFMLHVGHSTKRLFFLSLGILCLQILATLKLTKICESALRAQTHTDFRI